MKPPRITSWGLLSVEQAIKRIRAAQEEGLVVGLCHGCFDILHFGHLRHFQSAATLCDVLIVSVTADRFVNKGPKRPIFKAERRAELLSGLACIDGVVVSQYPTAIEVLGQLRPNRFFKGQEYESKSAAFSAGFQKEREFALGAGIEVMHTHEETFSSTETLNRLEEALRES